MSFKFTRITPHITQIRHKGPITLADSRALRATLNELDGMLLVDLNGTPFGDSFKEYMRVRSLLPKTAFYGPEGTEHICCTLPGKDYYRSDFRHFTDKEEALSWLLADDNVDRAQESFNVA